MEFLVKPNLNESICGPGCTPDSPGCDSQSCDCFGGDAP